jgi:hypothetical protein
LPFSVNATTTPLLAWRNRTVPMRATAPRGRGSPYRSVRGRPGGGAAPCAGSTAPSPLRTTNAQANRDPVMAHLHPSQPQSHIPPRLPSPTEPVQPSVRFPLNTPHSNSLPVSSGVTLEHVRQHPAPAPVRRCPLAAIAVPQGGCWSGWPSGPLPRCWQAKSG